MNIGVRGGRQIMGVMRVISIQMHSLNFDGLKLKLKSDGSFLFQIYSFRMHHFIPLKILLTRYQLDLLDLEEAK